MKNNWRLKPDDRIGCRVVFLPWSNKPSVCSLLSPGGQVDVESIHHRGSVRGRHGLLGGTCPGVSGYRRAVSFESNNRLTVSPTSIRDISSPHRASIWPWPDTRVIYQVVPGLVSRWRRGGMHAALVSSWCRSGILGWTPGRRRHEPHAKETDVVSSRMTGRRQSESW